MWIHKEIMFFPPGNNLGRTGKAKNQVIFPENNVDGKAFGKKITNESIMFPVFPLFPLNLPIKGVLDDYAI